MSANILTRLGSLHKKIGSTHSAFSEALNISDKMQRQEARNKACDNYYDAVYEYVNSIVHAIADKSIGLDPFSVLYGSGLQGKIGEKALTSALDKIRDNDPEVFSKVDIVMAKAVTEGLISRWRAKLSNGVDLIVNSRGMQFMLGWCKRSISFVKETYTGFINWIKKVWHKVFDKNTDTAEAPQPVAI